MPRTPKKAPTRGARASGPVDPAQPRCGLCGATRNLTRTECCGNWICDDADEYVLFSFARNSCYRNHDRYTLCAYHFNEQHAGDWQTCRKCRDTLEPEMYVWYGTNEYNFEKLATPPAYEPTHCASCGQVIRLAEDGYVLHPTRGYLCLACGNLPDDLQPRPRRKGRSGGAAPA
jgi:hypothetical protein